ncbi:MFS transporter [Kineosporia sp. J2-2]|uniref:MFS transporter n=1 Tax=Kineosporia corallincola TaxID=2835133 RepID=A0ABS5TN52_9ACTN|nr:MFS transporter [Kineosporia corallincola]MBT0772520.1 MFS transporter [Kineosporia corallincola]
MTEQRTTRHTGLLLAAVCLCQVMVVLDVSVVNVALPSIAKDLDFSAGSLSWVVNAYTLLFGGLLLLGGRFGDLAGHRRALFLGLAGFGVVSVLAGLAQSPGQLIAARAAQGLAGAVLAPLSLTIIMVTFPEGRERSRAVGIWAMVAASGSALGVLLGGVLTEWLSWRWVMWVNAPIVLLTLALAWPSVHDTRTARPGRLDVPGALLATVSLTALVNGAIRAGDYGWGAPWALGSFAVAAVTAALFVGCERRAAEPLVRLGVFRSRPVWVAGLVSVFLGATAVSGFYFASLALQDVLGYSPVEAGAAFLPFCVGTVLGAMVSGRLSARFGLRPVLSAGMFLSAVGMFVFGRIGVDSTFLGTFLLPSVVASVGVGAAMVANTSLGTTGALHHEAGLVSGLMNATRQCGGSLALAVLAGVALSSTRGFGGPDPLAALIHGYDRAFQVTGLFALAAAVVALVFVPRDRQEAARPA